MTRAGAAEPDCARQLCDRFAGVITDCEFSIAVTSDAEKEILRDLAKAIQSESLARARKTIIG